MFFDYLYCLNSVLFVVNKKKNVKVNIVSFGSKLSPHDELVNMCIVYICHQLNHYGIIPQRSSCVKVVPILQQGASPVLPHGH